MIVIMRRLGAKVEMRDEKRPLLVSKTFDEDA